MNTKFQISINKHPICSVQINMFKWNKTSEAKPTKEKQYLCCSIYTNRPHFKVLSWSNNLYEVDNYDFCDCKGESGFYAYDSEYGYYKNDCDYWQEIKWEK